jgi:hypothetical protein
MVHLLPTPPKSPSYICSAKLIASLAFEVGSVPIPLFIGLVIMHICRGETFHQEAVSSPIAYRDGQFVIVVSRALLYHFNLEMVGLSMALWSRPFGVRCARHARQKCGLTLRLCSPTSHFWCSLTWSAQSTTGGDLMSKSLMPFNGGFRCSLHHMMSVYVVLCSSLVPILTGPF